MKALAKIAASLVLVLAGLFVSPVSADQGWHRGRGRGRGRGHYQRYQDNAAGAFWGGVLGGWIAQAFRPDREARDVEGDLEPGTEEWFQYCKNKYRSFNPETGNYRTYDGDEKPCR